MGSCGTGGGRLSDCLRAYRRISHHLNLSDEPVYFSHIRFFNSTVQLRLGQQWKKTTPKCDLNRID